MIQLAKVNKSQMPNGFEIWAPVTGTITPLSVMNQPILTSGHLGEGIAITINGNNIVAPMDCTLTELCGSGQRIQLKATNGIKITLLFTQASAVLMGEGFNPKVTQGQQLNKGQLIATFNLQKRQSLSLERQYHVAVMITNAELLGQIFYANEKVTAGEDIVFTITAKKKR